MDEEATPPSSAHKRVPTPRGPECAELRIGTARFSVSGRALHLMLWIAGHQDRINDAAWDNGELWLTWKGQGASSIAGNIKTKL